MKPALLCMALAITVFAVSGCRAGNISDTDRNALNKEFSDENYERNMRAAGKGAEYEAEKKRQEDAYQQGGQ